MYFVNILLLQLTTHGRISVITSAVNTAPLILRHELGHSIIEVGEEYDGGDTRGYFGVNAYHNLNDPVPWKAWLSDDSSSGAARRIERAVMPFQEYTWTLLNTSQPWTTTFSSAGTYSRHLLRISLSGLPDKADLKIELDGVDLEWVPRPDIGVDRWFYDHTVEKGLSAGEHKLSFTLRNGARQGTAQLCSVEVLEFGDEKEFVVPFRRDNLWLTSSPLSPL